jgi:hypothetical protein
LKIAAFISRHHPLAELQPTMEAAAANASIMKVMIELKDAK